MRRYDVTPVAKVRQTQSDKWKQRPCVMRFRAFADEMRRLKCELQDGDSVVFVMPMPASWNSKKRTQNSGRHHRQKPDLDNLLGGLMDAIMPGGDSHIAHLASVSKLWGETGSVTIGNPFGQPRSYGSATPAEPQSGRPSP